MDIRVIQEPEKAKFNDFAARFPTGDLLQSWEWGDVKAKSSEWQPIRILAEDNGQTVGTALVLKRKLPKVGKSIFYCPRGPVVDFHNETVAKALVDYIGEVAKEHGAILLKIDPPVKIEDVESEKVIRSLGFNTIADPTGFGGTQPKCVMQLDLDKTPDDLLASFKPKWRYNIRLAEKKGVTVRTDCTKDDLRAFYDLLKVTAERDRFLVRGFKYYEVLWDVLVPQGYAKLFLTYHEDQPIAGAIDFVFGDRCWYVYGASSNEHRNLMPNHLMQWTMIQWAHSLGCKWYDFRGVSPRRDTSEEEDHLQGLNRFKEGFSPRYVEYIGEYDLPYSNFWYWLWVQAKPKVTAMLKARKRREITATAE